MSRYLSTRNISSRSMHALLSNLANRHTDRQTDKQTQSKTCTSSFVGGNERLIVTITLTEIIGKGRITISRVIAWTEQYMFDKQRCTNSVRQSFFCNCISLTFAVICHAILQTSPVFRGSENHFEAIKCVKCVC